MSRSTRRTPIIGHTGARSERFDKSLAHRRERRAVDNAIVSADDTVPLPHEHEFYNAWDAAKDGKGRFDPTALPHLMRK